MNLSHAGFILAAYGITALVVIGMLGAIVLDHRALTKALSRFPARDGEGDAR